jgi:NADH-quinone oxidoreductase subunit M
MLWLYQNIFFVDTNPKLIGLPDINTREILTLLPLVILVFWIGIYPNIFLSFMDVSVQHLMERISMSGPQLSQQVGEILR